MWVPIIVGWIFWMTHSGTTMIPISAILWCCTYYLSRVLPWLEPQNLDILSRGGGTVLPSYSREWTGLKLWRVGKRRQEAYSHIEAYYQGITFFYRSHYFEHVFCALPPCCIELELSQLTILLKKASNLQCETCMGVGMMAQMWLFLGVNGMSCWMLCLRSFKFFRLNVFFKIIRFTYLKFEPIWICLRA